MNTITRKAEANWKGNLSDGHGLVSTESKVLAEARYSFSQRVGEDSQETNPEELIGAAAASCFAMALSKTLEDKGVTAEKFRVGADISLEVEEEGLAVNRMKISVDARIPEFDESQLEQAVSITAENCPVYQLLEPGLESVEVASSLQP